MVNSFLFPFFVLLSLSFIAFSARSTDSSIGDVMGDESEQHSWCQTNPCLVMLSNEFQYNKEKGIAYKFTHRGGKKGLERIAKNKMAQSLDDEGLKWKKYCLHKPHIWSTDICRGIKANSHNPFYLSYADLYAFYRVKDQLEEGTAMLGLWEDFFPTEEPES